MRGFLISLLMVMMLALLAPMTAIACIACDSSPVAIQVIEKWSDVVTDKSRAGPVVRANALKETFILIDQSDMIEAGGNDAIVIYYKKTRTAKNATIGKRAFWFKA